MNDQLLIAAQKWFAEIEVPTVPQQTCLWVSRSGIVALGLDSIPAKAYAMVLQELRAAQNTKKLYWGGEDTEYMWLKAF